MKSSIYISFIAGLLTLAACDVNRIPETQLSDASFWKSENDLKAATNYLYTFLPGLLVTDDIWSDDAFALVSNEISDGSRLPEATSTAYSRPYQLIRAANNILEKVELMGGSDVPPERIDIYKGETSFFRAWAYFSLLQRYGGVPLITKTLTESAPELFAPKASREEVLSAIYADLDYAIERLPTPTTLGTTDYGRISKTAAQAFKARVALFEGTRMKFHGYGNPDDHLAVAAASAKAVIDSREHELFGDYFNLFQLPGDGRQNRENILVRQYGANLNNNISSHNSSGLVQNGAASPTKALVDSYLMTDGLPITKSPLYVKPETALEEFANRDPRMGASIMKRGDPYILGSVSYGIPPLNLIKTGYMERKYFNSADHASTRSFIDYAIIRYAEVLLIYAEAQFEQNDAISNADLDISINLIRGRVGMPALTNEFVTANNLSMREEIRRERRVELAMEGFRYWDLIRWKTAEIELPKPILGSYLYEEFGTIDGIVLTPDNYILVQNATTRSFKPERDYLWPFPVAELALNTELEQNPNW